MRVMTMRDFRRHIGRVLGGDEEVVLLKRGVPASLIIPVSSETGRQLLASRRFSLYRAFIGQGESGAERVSEEHDAHIYT